MHIYTNEEITFNGRRTRKMGFYLLRSAVMDSPSTLYILKLTWRACSERRGGRAADPTDVRPMEIEGRSRLGAFSSGTIWTLSEGRSTATLRSNCSLRSFASSTVMLTNPPPAPTWFVCTTYCYCTYVYNMCYILNAVSRSRCNWPSS